MNKLWRIIRWPIGFAPYILIEVFVMNLWADVYGPTPMLTFSHQSAYLIQGIIEANLLNYLAVIGGCAFWFLSCKIIKWTYFSRSDV